MIFREGRSRRNISQGVLLEEGERESGQKDGTLVEFKPDPALFNHYSINLDFVWEMVRHYAYLNKGLRMQLNGTEFISKNGLLDLVNESMAEETLYPPIHLAGTDIEMVITHTNDTGESIMLPTDRTHPRAEHTFPLSGKPLPGQLKSFTKKILNPQISGNPL